MDWGLLFNFLFALLAILNPFAAATIFLAFTFNKTRRVRMTLALLISGVVFGLLLLFLFTGQAILEAFNITIPAFRIAGGILLLLIGLGMVLGQRKPAGEFIKGETEGDEFEQAKSELSNILVPIAVPILVGPGAISTVILYSHKSSDWKELFGMALVLGFASLFVLICFIASEWVQKVIGKNGIEITTRLLGLILSAIAVQFFLDGLGEATIGIINPEFTHTES